MSVSKKLLYGNFEGVSKKFLGVLGLMGATGRFQGRFKNVSQEIPVLPKQTF